MILLAVGLPDLRFQAGLSIPGAEPGSASDSAVQSGALLLSPFFSWVLQSGVALTSILLLLALVAGLLKRRSLKRTAALALVLLLSLVLFSQLPRWASMSSVPLVSEAPARQIPSFAYTIAPIGDPPVALFRGVIAGLALVLTGLIAWWFMRAWRRAPAADPLALEADAAVQAIHAGQELKNVILRCYVNMERAVAEEQGLERGEAVTAREFEQSLAEHGIPRAPVLQLTRLFEQACYGNQALGAQDEQAAVDSLLAIRAACQPGQRGAH